MKATRKLVLRREAVRTLASAELRGAAGGSVAGQLATTACGTGTGPAADSGAKACGTSFAVGSGDAACTTAGG
jgi:hypothetical protein